MSTPSGLPARPSRRIVVQGLGALATTAEVPVGGGSATTGPVTAALEEIVVTVDGESIVRV